MRTKKLWEAADVDTECEIQRIVRRHEETQWHLSMTKGLFSGDPTILLDRKDMTNLHGMLQNELYPEQTDEQKYGTTDPATIAYEKMAEGIRDITKLLKELGVPEPEINNITDKIHEVEFINRRYP